MISTEVSSIGTHTTGLNVRFSGPDVYTHRASNKLKFPAVEVGMNVAEAMKRGIVERYAYLTGIGASQRWSPVMFARVKESDERVLQNVGLARATIVRPMEILERMAEDGLADPYPSLIERVMPEFMSVEAPNIAQALEFSR
jgi:hypothetical protein